MFPRQEILAGDFSARAPLMERTGSVTESPCTLHLVVRIINSSVHVRGNGGNDMKLTGELKEKVEKTENKEEAKKVIEDAGMILDDA